MTAIRMLLALLSAAVLVLGHHFFYQSLADQIVYNQSLHIYAGVAFAILVTIALGIALAIAYDQLLWKTLLKTPQKVARIDALSDMPRDVLSARWHPLLALALIIWLIPIAMIFPPGTLTVEDTTNTTQSNGVIWLANLGSLGHERYHTENGGSVDIDLWPEALPVAAYAALSGQITHYGLDGSYSYTAAGPALECTSSYQPNATLPCKDAYFQAWITNQTGCSTQVPTTLSQNTSLMFGAQGIYPATGYNITTCNLVNATYAVTLDDSVHLTKLNTTPIETMDVLKGMQCDTDACYTHQAWLMFLMFAETIAGTDTGDNTQTIWSNTLAQTAEYKAFYTRWGKPSWTQPTVADTLEKMFEDVYWSVATSKALGWTRNARVSHTIPALKYRYDVRTLWASYAAAFGSATIAVIVAMVVIMKNGQYTSHFSTHIRAMEGTCAGACPRHLAASTVTLGKEQIHDSPQYGVVPPLEDRDSAEESNVKGKQPQLQERFA